MIDLLLRSGSRPDTVTKKGLTPLDLMKKFGHGQRIPQLTADR